MRGREKRGCCPCTGGSGSAYIYGFCDRNWRPGMGQDECEAFVQRCVGHALARDGSSGGCIRTVCISAAGVKRSFLANDEVGSLGLSDPWSASLWCPAQCCAGWFMIAMHDKGLSWLRSGADSANVWQPQVPGHCRTHDGGLGQSGCDSLTANVVSHSRPHLQQFDVTGWPVLNNTTLSNGTGPYATATQRMCACPQMVRCLPECGAVHKTRRTRATAAPRKRHLRSHRFLDSRLRPSLAASPAPPASACAAAPSASGEQFAAALGLLR